ncbi:MAG TPA: hypothetical protein VKR42_05260 [Ktedonobacteraceae bacterium]|nr:hypothetical protein [Ktedonobacteraceae bacterium]
MSTYITSYVAARTELLAHITTTLQNDGRFVAEWLTGSFGRGEQDDLSDLDIRVIVADEYSETLCSQPWPHGAHTTDERLALFSLFGNPSVVYDAHGNAPEGGTFTYVLYENGQNVDWILVPQSKAQRATDTVLLFDTVGIPLEPAPESESLEQRITIASDMTGFFWMIAASSLRYLYPSRYDAVNFHMLLDWLHNALHDVQRAVDGTPWKYHSGAYAKLAPTRRELLVAYRDLCNRMLALMPEVERMGGSIPTSPMLPIEFRLNMLEETEI